MPEVDESTAWGADSTGVLDDSYRSTTAAAGWRSQVAEFTKGAAEMSVEFGRGVRGVVKQSVLKDDSEIMRKMKVPCANICRKLRFLNEYLPEDRDPLHAWSIIACVSVFALAALIATANQSRTPSLKKMKVHPASASLVLLPDGRHLAYQERGVSADQARYTMIITHSFLSSRLAGIPGVKDSLLREFGVRLVTYDLPGFGESDPHPRRSLESSALDMLHLSYAVNVTGKFWVVGFSDGSIHAWSALRYIPPAMSEFIRRVLPDVMLQRLPYEGRFTYFYLCDECHRQMFTTVFGNPQGPLPMDKESISSLA